jgi:REP element-mobilizing transposase RayT
MPHSFTCNFIHVVFSTKQRAGTIKAELEEQLWAYLFGIAKRLGIIVVAIGGIDNHVHLLLSIPATHRLSECIQKLKSNSARWMNEHAPGFSWQEGYGAFSVSPSQLDRVQAYVRGQREHHQKHSFEDEFLALLLKSGVQFDSRYLFG